MLYATEKLTFIIGKNRKDTAIRLLQRYITYCSNALPHASFAFRKPIYIVRSIEPYRSQTYLPQPLNILFFRESIRSNAHGE